MEKIVLGTSFGETADDVNSDSASDRDASVFAAVKDYVEQALKVLPFNRVSHICEFDDDSATKFTCSDDPVEIAEKFAGYDVGIDVQASGLLDLNIHWPEAV